VRTRRVEQSHALCHIALTMKRRLTRMALMMVALPLGVRAAEAIADHLEAGRGPSTATKVLRQSSSLGRRLARRSQVPTGGVPRRGKGNPDVAPK
jgi:hypothetical protein